MINKINKVKINIIGAINQLTYWLHHFGVVAPLGDVELSMTMRSGFFAPFRASNKLGFLVALRSLERWLSLGLLRLLERLILLRRSFRS